MRFIANKNKQVNIKNRVKELSFGNNIKVLMQDEINNQSRN